MIRIKNHFNWSRPWETLEYLWCTTSEYFKLYINYKKPKIQLFHTMFGLISEMNILRPTVMYVQNIVATLKKINFETFSSLKFKIHYICGKSEHLISAKSKKGQAYFHGIWTRFYSESYAHFLDNYNRLRFILKNNKYRNK